MFLTAVLQAHTDSQTPTGAEDTNTDLDSLEETSVRLPKLDETLALPIDERLQTLPSAHRSRWV